MRDKSPHRHEQKKQSKGLTIKQKRAEKRAKATGGAPADPVAHLRRH